MTNRPLAAAALAAMWLVTSTVVGQELVQNGSFEEGPWRPLSGKAGTATSQGELPTQWQDVSTWSGASTRYARQADNGSQFLRLEMTKAQKPRAVLQLRSVFSLAIEAGQAYRVKARLRSPTNVVAELAIRQPEPPRIKFWETRFRVGRQWQDYQFILEPTQSGAARFYLAFRELGMLEADSLCVVRLDESQRPAPKPPAPIVGVRCVKSRSDLLRHSDIIAMYQESNPDVLRKYLIDVVAWGGQLQATKGQIAKRKQLLDKAYAAGVRLYAVDCAMAQEGGRFVVSQGDRQSPHQKLFYALRKDNAGTIRQLGELGVDLTHDTVLNVQGEWIGVPWLRKRWRIPMASVYSPAARQWFREHMQAIGKTGATAIHFDEPAMGSYGVQHPTPGDFSTHAMAAFREWLRDRPQEVWRDAGVSSLDDFDYRQFVLEHGGNPRATRLWREFVRFQLFTTRDYVRQLRDIVRQTAGRDIPLSMNANASSWIKLPFLEVQDFMTTEVAHQATSRKVPESPLLVYKLADAFRTPVASTAHGHDWYEMRTDQHPVLVSSWLAMGYALGHHLMMPCKAWVMDPVKGSGTYRPISDEYACMARFIKAVAPLLDGYEAISVLGVALGCDAIERDATTLRELTKRLADENVPFSLAVEGNDLLQRQVTAEDLHGASAVLLASPALMSAETLERIKSLTGDRPCAEHYGGALPGFVPRPISVEGTQGIWVLPRMKPGNREAPIAVHLINRDYDAKTRKMTPKGPFTVVLDSSLFPGRSFTQARLRQPELLPVLSDEQNAAATKTTQIVVRSDSGKVTLRIPSLDLWGVLELR